MPRGIFVKDNVQSSAPSIVNLNCPTCRRAGAFHGYEKCLDVIWGPTARPVKGGGGVNYTSFWRAGMRKCPNTDCGALTFILIDGTNDHIVAYPPEVIDFDATDLPPKILASLEEAISCHAAGAYKACALMVRRVLEELCEDKKATGNNLKARIESLKSVAIIPGELLVAADELRILGNDAAHVEAKDYDAIGQVEAKLAIELAKELLKAVYQYTSLVAQLKALKKTP